VPKFFLDEVRKLQPSVPYGSDDDQSAFTGERFLPGYSDGSMELLHVHRYSFALPYVFNQTVLDIACGEGYGSDLMAQVAQTVIGVDLDEATILLAQKRYLRPNLSFKKGSATAIPIDDHSIDVVVTFETVEHLSDQDAFWSEIKRVLREDGLAVISSPNRDIYNQQRCGENPFHHRELTQQELLQELSKRFAHHQLFSQSIEFGSLLTPCVGGSIPRTVISLDPTLRTLAWQVGDEMKHPYSVALASDQPVAAAGQSLYAGYYPKDAMASLAGGIAERDQVIRDLKQQLSCADSSHSAAILETQASFDAALASSQNRHDSVIAAAQAEHESALLAAHNEHDLAIAALQKERDDAMSDCQRAQLNFDEQRQILTRERDEALLHTRLVKETLAEQDKAIGALKSMVDVFTQRLAKPDARARPGTSGE
jgi:SAM-dependent methyltransferase